MKERIVIPEFKLDISPSTINDGANQPLQKAMQLLTLTGKRDRDMKDMMFFPMEQHLYLGECLQLVAADSHPVQRTGEDKDMLERTIISPANSVYSTPVPGVHLVTTHLFQPKGGVDMWYLAVDSEGSVAKAKEKLWKFLTVAAKAIREKNLLTEKKTEKTRRELLDRIILPKDQRDAILHEVGSFVKAEKIYQELGLPWKRGIVLYGPPGNGKTLLLRTIAAYFSMDIRDMSNNMQEGEVQMPRSLYGNDSPIATQGGGGCISMFTVLNMFYPEKRKPMVYYIEDMDKIMPGNGSDIPKVRLGALLNTIDGINKLHGVLFIATTNHADNLAEAIMSRPGRFDSLYEIGQPGQEQILQMLRLHKLTVGGKEPTAIAKELVGYSMAFAEEYVKIAKTIYHVSDLTQDQAREILKRIHDHNNKYRSSFKKGSGIGFGGN